MGEQNKGCFVRHHGCAYSLLFGAQARPWELCRDLLGSVLAASGPERPWWSVDCSPSSRTLEKPHLTVGRDLHYIIAGEKYSSRFVLISSTRSIVGIGVLATVCGWGCRSTMVPPFGASVPPPGLCGEEERLLAVDPNWTGEIRSWDRFGRVS
jgi:hypothetical protein